MFYVLWFIVNLVLNCFNSDMVFDGNMMMYWLIKVVIVNLNGNFVVNVFIIYISKVRSKNKLILIYFLEIFYCS